MNNTPDVDVLELGKRILDIAALNGLPPSAFKEMGALTTQLADLARKAQQPAQKADTLLGQLPPGLVKNIYSRVARLAQQPAQEGYDFDADFDTPECLRERLILAKEHIEQQQAALAAANARADEAEAERDGWKAVAHIVAWEGGERAMRLIEALESGPPSPLYPAAREAVKR